MITDKPVSIPESKLIVSKLRRLEETAGLGEDLRLDYFHKFTVPEVVDELRRRGYKKASEQFVLEAVRRIVRA
jgi:hypothetical protein